MYEYHNNILSIPARLLYEDWGLISYSNYQNLCKRGKLVRTREARGLDNVALVSVYDLPVHRGVCFKDICFKKLDDPREVVVRNHLEAYIVPDIKAARFFAEHRKPDGRPLSEELQREKATNSMILNAIQMVFESRSLRAKVFGNKTMQIWTNVSEAVNSINSNKWVFSLPGNPRRLKAKYEDYLKESYMTFIHKGEGNNHYSKRSCYDCEF